MQWMSFKRFGLRFIWFSNTKKSYINIENLKFNRISYPSFGIFYTLQLQNILIRELYHFR